MRWIFKWWLLLSISFSAQADAQSALEFIRATATEITSEISANQAELESNPDAIYQLIESKVIPHFDFSRMSALAVGEKNWKNATVEQQTAFEQAFQVMLVKTYGTALKTYSNEQVNYLSSQKLSNGDTVANTSIQPENGNAIPLSYTMYQEADKWKIYDVTINRISLISNYKRSFSRLIRRFGMDGLVKKLQAKVKI